MRRIVAAISVFAALVCCTSKPESEEPVVPADTRVLTLTAPSSPIEWNAGSFSVGISVNFAYSVEVDASWVSADASRTTASELWFTCSDNDGSISRTVTIKVSDKNDRYYTKSVSVTQGINPDPDTVISIVDKNATEETKALLANLYLIGDRGFMFGHHDDLWYGRYWYNEPGRSDTKEVCGDYPAVFSVDFGEITDNRFNNGENKIRRRVILEARERGELILAVMHLNNPQTGGDAWDNSKRDVVKNILTEGNSVRTKYLQWLDHLADFANDLKDSRGNLVPVILRPYHEHTQGWSWWGSSCTTESEFIAFWRMTVEYLRDVKGVHNFLYAISPQMDSWYSESEASSRIVYRWPGDDYVDFIGMDCYHGNNPAALRLYLDAIEYWATLKNKPYGVTEDGIEGFSYADYWTYNILEPLKGRRACMAVMWRNKYVGSNDSDRHFYSIWPGHPSEPNFMRMYEDPESLFSSDLPDMYSMPAKVVIQ